MKNGEKKATDRMNWRLLIENAVRESERNKTDNGNGNHDQFNPVDRDAKKRTTTNCNLSLV